MPFTVSVPAGTAAGEYLAGVVAGPADPAPALTTARTQAAAVVVARVGIGVAITVPGPLSPSISIPNVALSAGGSAILSVTVHNSGNTWEHPRGRALVQIGRTTRAFPLAAATILPGDTATLPLTVSEIRNGAWPTEVELWYDHHHRLATWLGSIGYTNIPAGAAAAHTTRAPAPQTTSSVPSWAILTIGGLAGFSLALSAVFLFLLAPRRRRSEQEKQPGPRRRRRRDGQVVLRAVTTPTDPPQPNC